MKSELQTPAADPAGSILDVVVRWLAGGLFLWMGLSKAMHPEVFLKLIRAYGVVEVYWLLNLIAVILPWFEACCGLLLLLGVAIRGTVLVMAGMLVSFTVLVFQRGMAIHAAGGMAWCGIRFDCGCGAGEVNFCLKLIENAALVVLMLWLLGRKNHPASLRARLWSGPAA